MKNELSLNNNTIILNKYRFLFAILLITIIASISPLTSFAQEETRERGWNGRIIKAELLQKLLNLKEDEFVAGYIINGSDIIEIIEESDIDIKIKNSVIEGGLDFTNLPVVKDKREVNNKIIIKNSEIGFWVKENRKKSVSSGNILFSKLISFRETLLSEEADFIKAQFTGKASFGGAKFSGSADFREALFSEEASFGGAQFSGISSFYNAQFSEDTFFKGAQFSEDAYFWNAQFSGKADFGGAQFSEEANFREAHFSVGADFREAQFSGKTDFREAQFSEAASFGGAQFSDSPTFYNAKFRGQANFNNAKFSGGANFNNAKFSEAASFGGAQFSDSATFNNAKFRGKAGFNNAQFSGKTDFREAQFSDSATFNNAKFRGKAGFNNAKFSGEADFGGAKFSGEANFLEAQFSEKAYFREAQFSGEAAFSGAKFSGPVFFSEAQFSEAAAFSHAQFSGSVFFSEAQFSGRAIFIGAQFAGEAYFREAQFSAYTDFSGAQFGDQAYFGRAVFSERADFGQAQFGGVSFHLTTFGAETNFRYVRIYGALELEESNFEGNVDLRNSTIRKLLLKESSLVNSIDVPFDFRDATITEAHFEELQFTQKINFSDVAFGVNVVDVDFIGPLQLDNQSPATVFRTVTFLSDANFTRAKFYGDVAFEIVNFEGKANFTNAEFKPATNGNKPRLSLSYVTFEDPILDLGQFPNPGNWVKDEKIASFHDKERASENRSITGKGLQLLSQVFQGLEATFNRKNKLSDKNKAFYHMKVEKLEEARADKSLYQQLTTGEVWGWVLWGWSSGWGTKIWRIVGVYTAGLFFFAFIFYGFSGRVKKKDTGEIKHDSEFRMRLINFPWYFMKSVEIKNKDVNEFFVAMRLSIVLLLKVGRRDTEVEGKLMKSIVWIEWVFGYYLLAVLVITLKNTVPIINSLISGVF